MEPIQADRIRIWVPETAHIDLQLVDAVARCLAEAFSSCHWSSVPMPLGDCSAPHSARGILARFRGKEQLVLATLINQEQHQSEWRVVGSVLGSILDEALIDSFALGEFGAHAGDGLLAFIGLTPDVQKTRGCLVGNDIFQIRGKSRPASPAPEQRSLVGWIFKRWLELPGLRDCPHLYIRTRLVIKPILHLIQEHHFAYCGRFHMDYQGETQDRMVFRRTNR